MLKKIITYVMCVISMLCVFGCSKANDNQIQVKNNVNTQNEYIEETHEEMFEEKEDSAEEFSDEDLTIKILDTKCIMEYPNDSTIEDVETVEFGFYPQSDYSGSEKEPIEWIVLEKNSEKALLLSKYLLDCKRYNEENDSVIWENCGLRFWLNEEFYNKAFTDNEKDKIISANIFNNANSMYGTDGGKNTEDKVFCLSADECIKYFGVEDEEGNNYLAATKGTKYSNLSISDVDDIWDKYNGTYWLRTPGRNTYFASLILPNGSFDLNGNGVYADDIGVRPVVWVSIENSGIDNSDDDTKNSKDTENVEKINDKTYYDYIENIDIKYNNIGKSVGYQIYDINNDGVDELILYGKVDTNDIINLTNYNAPPFRLVCLPFIDKIYTTKNGEVVPFEIYNGMNGTVKDGNVLNAFFGLNGEKVALYNVVDEKIKSIKVIDYINGNIKNIPLDKNIDKAYYEEIDAEYYNLEKQEMDQYEEEYNEIYSSIGHVNGWDGLDVIFDIYNDKNIQEKHTYKERGGRRIYKKNGEEITSDNDTYNVSLKIKEVSYSGEEVSITAVLEDSINKAPYIEYVQGNNGGAKTTHYSYLDNGTWKSIQSKHDLIGLDIGMSYTQALVDLECQYNQELTFDIPLYSLNRPINNHCMIDYCGYGAEFDIIESKVNINENDNSKDKGKDKNKNKNKDIDENDENSNIELLYMDVIKSIKDEVDIYEPGDDITPVGVTTYAGHQFYDMDGDGELELIIYRNEAYGKVFIDSVYKIENEKPKIFDLSKYGSADVYESYLQSDYKSGGTRDIVYYALTDGKVAKTLYHWGSMEDLTQIYGFPESYIEDIYNNKFLSIVGYFPSKVIYK